MIIKSMYVGAYNMVCDVMGDKWSKLTLPAPADGCVDVELADNCKIEVTNNHPMIALKFGRKTVFIPRCNYDVIEIY